MRRFLALLAVAALGAVVYVAAAPGGLQASPTAQQFAALKRQVAGLSGKVKTLKGQVGSLNSQLAALKTDETAVKALATDADGFIHTCIIPAGVAGVSRFGDPAGASGYSYTDSTAHQFFTTALDADGSSAPGAFLQTVAASCVSSGTALRKNGVPSEHRQSTLAATQR
jgi:hypothetical protein